MSLTPDVICMLSFVLLTSYCFKNLQLMGAMLIECIETRVESSSSDLPVANHVTIYWTPDSVIYVWCFNRNINSSQ